MGNVDINGSLYKSFLLVLDVELIFLKIKSPPAVSCSLLREHSETFQTYRDTSGDGATQRQLTHSFIIPLAAVKRMENYRLEPSTLSPD